MSASSTAEAAKAELVECEKEINSIRAALRMLRPSASSAEADATNSLSVVALKIEGLAKPLKPKISLQLSSPVEEATLTELFDAEADDPPSSMKASFKGVETGQATLTLEVSDDQSTSLGSSEPLDLAHPTSFDAMSTKKEHESEVSLVVKGEGEAAAEPVCTVVLRLSYTPSAAEKKAKLYELLAVATKKKASVVEKLRHASMASSGSQVATKSSASPAVKAGFLNKQKNEEFSLKTWFDSYFGPQSFIRRNFHVAKNYIVFFGAVGFFHFQGHVLALPPPV